MYLVLIKDRHNEGMYDANFTTLQSEVVVALNDHADRVKVYDLSNLNELTTCKIEIQ